MRTSKLGAISKTQKAKVFKIVRPFGDIEKFLEKIRTIPKKLKGGPFSLVRFCRLTLKSKK